MATRIVLPVSIAVFLCGSCFDGDSSTSNWTDSTAWALEEDLRIGTVEGQPEYQFGEIVGIDAFSDGRIVVRDVQAERQLRVFLPDGEYVVAFGGTGSGPGELGAGYEPPLVGRGDTLLVPDVRNQRFNAYTHEGVFKSSTPIQIPSTEGTPKWDVNGSGQVVAQLSTIPMPGSANDYPTDLLVAFDLGGSVDTLLTFPSAAILTIMPSGLPHVNLFSPEPAWALGAGDSIWYGPGEPYRFGSYVGGELVLAVTRDAAPRIVTAQDRAVALGAWEQIFGEEFEDMAAFADVLPAYQKFLAEPDGILWVQQIEPPGNLTEDERAAFDPEGGYGGDFWDVFDSAGRYLGAVTMPPSFTPMRFAGGALYGVWRDEMDVEFVVRLRVVR